MVAAETEVNQEQNNSPTIAENISSCEWYLGIIQFLIQLEVSPDLTPNQARALKLKYVKFFIIDKLLYLRDQSRILLRCLVLNFHMLS